MDLGDGYSLYHVSTGWDLARRRAPELPENPPSLGFSCFWEGDGWSEPQTRWLGTAGIFPTEGEWMIAEYLVITDSPDVPPRVRNEGIKRVIPNLLAVSVAMGKRLMFMNTSSGMAAILRNMGVTVDDGVKLLTSDRRFL